MKDAGVLNYGGASSISVDCARENFPFAAAQSLSFCCSPLELLANDGSDACIATATGFFWLEGDRPFVVTNWHVVSGRNPFTGGIVSSSGYIPRKIALYGHEVKQDDKMVLFQRRRYIIEFTDELMDLVSRPPRIAGCDVDIWAFPIQSGMVFTNVGFDVPSPRPSFSCYINQGGFQPVATGAGDDCFLLGYPLQNHEGLRLPVWKRGSVASDTNIGVDGKPIFLVDAAVTPSMSGSPVIRKVRLDSYKNKNGIISSHTACELIGVYAGRLQSKELDRVNLGYAWYKSLISKVIGSYTWGDWTRVLASEC